MKRHNLPADRWTKSSYSADTNGQCVEFQLASRAQVAVGDSKDRSQGAFVFPVTSWTSFVDAVKRDELPYA
ncbi:DUF397 domain-containing protein [Streptomyces acidiscabies]|uniref:DUF397 domain-containing protein n=1 Tax=Streptomyces acidiscabies TaxID=42234 RepID=UPI0038F7EFDD